MLTKSAAQQVSVDNDAGGAHRASSTRCSRRKTQHLDSWAHLNDNHMLIWRVRHGWTEALTSSSISAPRIRRRGSAVNKSPRLVSPLAQVDNGGHYQHQSCWFVKQNKKHGRRCKGGVARGDPKWRRLIRRGWIVQQICHLGRAWVVTRCVKGGIGRDLRCGT